MNQQQKALLLIGPGKHFGLHVACKFAREGFVIGLIARDKKRLEEFAEALRAEGAQVFFACADVVRPEEMKSAVELIRKNIFDFSCVMYNVKASVPGSCLTVDPKEFTGTLETNVTGAIIATQTILPYMQEESSFILTGGGYKDAPDKEKLALSVSKAAIHTLTLASVEVLKEKHIFAKTIVINGVVREEGPIFSEDVAEVFWNAYKNNTVSVFEYPESHR